MLLLQTQCFLYLFYIKSLRWHNLLSSLEGLYCETLEECTQEVWNFINNSMLKYN